MLELYVQVDWLLTISQHHAAHMTFLDGLGSLPQLASYSPDALSRLKNDAIEELQMLVPFQEAEQSYAFDASNFVQLGSFAIPKGPSTVLLHNFNLQAPTGQGMSGLQAGPPGRQSRRRKN
jgi:midasin